MINIFGKLYTLLRRPQPAEETQTGETTQTGNTTQTGSKGAEGSQEPECKKGKQLAALSDSLTASSDFEHIPGPDEFNDSGTNIDVTGSAKKTHGEVTGQDSKPAYNQTLDMSELAKFVDEMSEEAAAAGTSRDQKEPAVGKPVDDNTKHAAEKPDEVDEVVKIPAGDEERKTAEIKASAGDKAKDKAGDSDSKEKKKGENKSPREKKDNKQKKVCLYFGRGSKCWKGSRCPFEHTRKGQTSEDKSHADGPATVEVSIKESDFSTYSEFVAAMTTSGRQLNAKDLLYKLGYQRDVTSDTMGQAVVGQYTLAIGRNNWLWVKDARYNAELFFSSDWINENLPTQGQVGKPKKSKQKKHKEPEWSTEPCRDFRIKENPNINVYTANAAGDGNLSASDNKPDAKLDTNVGQQLNGHGAAAENVNDTTMDALMSVCTERVLHQAMTQAIVDGLSDSAIMEVIDDVVDDKTVSSPAKTPLKKGKLTKVDLNRTPQKRPEQLALGFSYHSDELVKQSPKTVNGGIICLDNLPPAKEPVEQIAFGFNYHADKLVKESPVAANGEVLVPGIPRTPCRKARDQLAVGFNYHADLLAQTAAEIDDDDILVVTSEEKPKPNMNRNLNDNEKENLNQDMATDNTIPRKSARRSINDTFAVGFSYNSNLMMKQSLDEVNGNLPNGDVITSIIEDAQMNENRNVVEATVDDFPLANTPAGSVW